MLKLSIYKKDKDYITLNLVNLTVHLANDRHIFMYRHITIIIIWNKIILLYRENQFLIAALFKSTIVSAINILC